MPDPVVVRSLRELDALVAEKVDDWERCTDRSGDEKCYANEVVCGKTGGMDPGTNCKVHCAYPPYSTDIAAAFEVVGALEGKTIIEPHEGGSRPRENGGFQLLGPYIRKEWRAGWLERDHEYCLVDAEAPTAPLAIVLAALKAVGVEVELRLEETAGVGR